MFAQLITAAFSKTEFALAIDEKGCLQLTARGLFALIAMLLFSKQLQRLCKAAPKLPEERTDV
jgi:hypothetical protein